MLCIIKCNVHWLDESEAFASNLQFRVQAPTIQLLWNYSSSSHRWPAPATELPSQASFWFLHTATELRTIFANICKHAWAGTSERTPQYTHYHKHICTHTYLQYSFWSNNIKIWTIYARPIIFDSKNYGLSPFKYCLLAVVYTFNFQLRNWQLDRIQLLITKGR